MDLKNKTISSISWVAVNHFLQMGIGFISTLILAHLLLPGDFGLLGMATVFIAFINIIKDMGISSSVIQKERLNLNQLSTLFWINFIFSILLFFISIGISPIIASFFKKTILKKIIIVLSFNFPISSLSMISMSLLRKEMRFKKISFIRTISTIFGNIIAILMALFDHGVWSLVWSQIAANMITTILIISNFLFIPRLVLNLKNVSKELKFGINLQLNGIVNYFSRNADDIIIGKYLNNSALGIYQMAYRIMLWPLKNISKIIGQVMFPALSSISRNNDRVKKIYLKTISSVAFITFPMVLGALILSQLLIQTLLGEEWLAVIPVFRILCILGLTQSILTNSGWIFTSQGKADIQLKMNTIFSLLYIISFLVGIRWGIKGVAVSYTVMSLVLTPIQLHIVGKIIKMSFIEPFLALYKTLLSALIMAGLVFIEIKFLLQHLSPIPQLIISIPSGIVFYLFITSCIKIDIYQEFKEILLGQIKSLKLKIKKYVFKR